jgi:hypothetical protein
VSREKAEGKRENERALDQQNRSFSLMPSPFSLVIVTLSAAC